MQRLDEYSAHDPQDITSIQNAQRDYRQISETISQMRRNPEEYLRANMGIHDTGGDIRKMPSGRIQQIYSNMTRLRNRAASVKADEIVENSGYDAGKKKSRDSSVTSWLTCWAS